MPPKTNLENYIDIPHLEQLLLWFLKNDKQISLISSTSIKRLFKEGYRSALVLDNDANILNDDVNNQTVERWIVIRVWLDLISVKTISERDNVPLEKTLESRIDLLDKHGEKTLITSGTIAHKYDIEASVVDLDKELEKIPTEEERKIFKQNYIDDTLTATEIRILAWIYKELFNKNYKIKK